MDWYLRSGLISLVFFLPLIAPAASAVVDIDPVTVGDPGNGCDSQPQGCFGSVVGLYQISRFEITNAQYAEFLNAVASTDTNALYNTNMGSVPGGITRVGSSGNFSYVAIPGRENMPVNFVSFWDAARFANWLHNDQLPGTQNDMTTEDGAYTLNPADVVNNTVIRNGGAQFFIPSEDEWYKAAYYAPGTMNYLPFPTGSNDFPMCAPSSGVETNPTPNTANCNLINLDLTIVGNYTNAASPTGTFDQGGNVWEWNESVHSGGLDRGLRGGGYIVHPLFLSAAAQGSVVPAVEGVNIGFRLASPVPPPEEVVIDWVTVEDPGNGCDSQSQGCFGSVADVYRISSFEITNAQYAEFLKAVATIDTNALYNPEMANFGGITRSGSSGSFSYRAIPSRADMPVNYVSFWDAARFANWLYNGQPIGAQDDTTTEDGAYTLTPAGISNNTVTRNEDADIFLPSEDEWYKAAYYDTITMKYFDYPAGFDAKTACTEPEADSGNSANCENALGDLSDVGSYGFSPSPNGTFDQGGNVWEWHEAIVESLRGIRGGSAFGDPGSDSAASVRPVFPAAFETNEIGFRVVPEPRQSIILVSGMVFLLLAQRRREALTRSKTRRNAD